MFWAEVAIALTSLAIAHVASRIGSWSRSAGARASRVAVMLFFLIGAGLIYASAGIGYRKEIFPPKKRKSFQLGLTYNTLIAPDGWTVPLNGFDALEDPRIWYPVSKRVAIALLALGALFLTGALAWKLLPDTKMDEDRVFPAFLVALLVGQLLIWVWSYRMAKTMARRLALVQQQASDPIPQ
jgi:hypothetical protein